MTWYLIKQIIRLNDAALTLLVVWNVIKRKSRLHGVVLN